MELLNIKWSTWDMGALDIESYFGYVSIPLQTIVLVVIIAIVFRVIKIKRGK